MLTASMRHAPIGTANGVLVCVDVSQGRRSSASLQVSNFSSNLFLTAAAQNLLCLDLATQAGVTLASPWMDWFIAAAPPCILGIAITPFIMYKVRALLGASEILHTLHVLPAYFIAAAPPCILGIAITPFIMYKVLRAVENFPRHCTDCTPCTHLHALQMLHALHVSDVLHALFTRTLCSTECATRHAALRTLRCLTSRSTRLKF